MKRKSLIICTLIVSLICIGMQSISYAKSFKADIKGSVKEKSNKEPLAFATVTILTSDNKIVAGATTDENGNFKITTPVSGSYKVKISFIGFKDHELDLVAGDKPIDMGTIELETDNQALAAAVITAKIPLVEQKLDKVVVNVSQSVLATTSNGYDILKKAPGISIDKDGNIKLNGQSVAIWIDGRPSNMSGSQLEVILTALDGSSIDKIEIMQHPSSKYDASGSGGIINIKTKRNFANGIYGSANANYFMIPAADKYDGGSGSVNLNYRGKKANTYVSYSIRRRPSQNEFLSDNLFGDNFELFQKSETVFKGHNSYNYVKAGSDIYLDKKNTFGFLISTLASRSTMSANHSTTDLFKNNIKTMATISKILQPDYQNNIDGNLYYTRTFSEQSDLTFNFDYGYYDIGSTGYQSNAYYDPEKLIVSTALKTNSKQYINIYSFKADYKMPLFKKGSIDAGVKFANSNTNNDMVHRDSIGGIFIVNNNMSSKFDYRENIGAAYFSLNYQISPKFSAVAGLRAEYTDSKGTWISADTTTKKHYLDFFPTVYIGYTPNQNIRLSASYTRRIQRPNFYQLNPFRVYIDANSIVVGDPNLAPQYADNISLSAGYKSFLSFTLFYNGVSNIIMQDPEIDQATGNKTIQWKNYGKMKMIGCNISISEYPFIKEKLFFNFNGMVNNVRNKSYAESSINPVNSNNFTLQLSSGLTAILGGGVKIESDLTYTGKMQVANLDLRPMWILSARVKKSFIDNKLTVSVDINDILQNYGPNIKFNSDKYRYTISQNQYRQLVTFGINYKFGKVKQSGKTNTKREDTSTRIGK